MTRVNIGCGMTPTPGWTNYDNSWSVRLARRRTGWRFLRVLRMLNRNQLDYIEFARINGITWADATRRIPHPDGSVEVVYASHMLEHFDPAQARKFLEEAFRVLEKGGTIRIVVPDLALIVADYLGSGDADKFMEDTRLSPKPLATLRDRLQHLVVGNRGHKWSYDGESLCKTLKRAGFTDIAIRPAGETGIRNPGNLDLAERSDGSLYVEGARR